jgi:hypothetical protein
MSVKVLSCTPTTVASGGTITVTLEYSADDAGFIVVNEGSSFDCVPGRIPIVAGDGMTTTEALRVTRQPNAPTHACELIFTLGPASYAIWITVT